jgi:hypothetical protein
MTIAEVSDPALEPGYPELVRRWAEDVWTAYAAQRDLARRWLDAARDHAAQQTRR